MTSPSSWCCHHSLALVWIACLAIAGCGSDDDHSPLDAGDAMDASIAEGGIDATRFDSGDPPDAPMADAGPGCVPTGEACTEDGACCNGFCDRPGGAVAGHCAALLGCRVAGEPCGAAGRSGICCSSACLDARGGGVPTCQRIGGCRPPGELCAEAGECCEGRCIAADTTEDGRTVHRCAEPAMSCALVGELCGAGRTVGCCPSDSDMSTPPNCTTSSEGLDRCTGGWGGCGIAPGSPCITTAECCAFVYETITCAPNAVGTRVCCLGAGDRCALGDTCCSGVCAPEADGTLRCAATCVNDGGRCTATSDCCGCSCVADPSGVLRCSRDAAECGSCDKAALGQSCAVEDDCCNVPLVTCATDRTRPTCVLR